MRILKNRKNGLVSSIKDAETGEIIWTREESIHRGKIGGETAQLLRDGKIQEYLARIHDIDLERQETEEE